jgi:type IV secretory pathway TraG/TraD family ATPase VirD4
MAAGLGVLVIAGFGLTGAVMLGHRLAGDGAEVPVNPAAVVAGLLNGSIGWTRECTVVAAAGGGALFLLGLVVLVVVLAAGGRHTRVDKAAQRLGVGGDIGPLTARAAAAKAKRLGVQASTPGLPLGRAVRGGAQLYSSWEDMVCAVAGNRTGKTTSWVIPAIAEAPGAVLTTSNKRDTLDATRDLRSDQGPVWVFDPQQVAFEPPTWWWNPLSYVTDDVRAEDLASHFSAAITRLGAKTDAYFTPAAETVLADMLLAAALDGRPITDAYRWLTRPSEVAPADVLREHGYYLRADQLDGFATLTPKQRDGVYGTAQQMAACLTVERTRAWVARQGPQDGRPELDVAELIDQGGTLYSLSREGGGSAGALVTALTVAAVTAAEDKAARSPGGRLAVPVVGVLDEAANVCRWRNLPELYSHYGSRGIVLATFLQSWSQGVEVWGREGMEKLWSTSNVKLYGGGVAEMEFLKNLSETLGDYDKVTVSVSSGTVTS